MYQIEAGDSPFPYNVFRVENKSVQTRSTTGQGPETTTATSNSTENLNITSDGISGKQDLSPGILHHKMLI